MRFLNWANRPIFAMLLPAFLLLVTLSVSSQAFAHGPPPGGCATYYGTEYLSDIVSFKVSNGLQEYDVLNNPGSIVQVSRDQDFTTRFTLHADPVGFLIQNGTEMPQNSTEVDGYAWYRDNANGYPFSKCVGPLEGSSYYEIEQDYPVSYMFQGEGPHPVFFETSLDDSRPKVEFYLQVVDAPGQIPAVDGNVGSQNDSQDEQDPLLLLLGRPNSTAVAGEDDVPVGDTLTINGRIASVWPVGDRVNPISPLQILTGNWSMEVNNTSVSSLKANITSANLNGTGRQNYELDNFTAINSSVIFSNGEITFESNVTAHSEDNEDNATNARLIVTLGGLSAVRFDIAGDSPSLTPIYGVVDNLSVSEDGQVIRTVTR